MNAKFIFRSLVPPLIWHGLRALFGYRNVLRGPYASWEEALENCEGYDSDQILERVSEATELVKIGKYRFERDSVLFNDIEYSPTVLAGLLMARLDNLQEEFVIDFGGSLGSSYWQNRNFFLPQCRSRWCVIEQPHFVEVGRNKFETETLKFFTSIDEISLTNAPSVLLFSASLHYLPNPKKQLDELLTTKPTILVIDRTPFTPDGQAEELWSQVVPKTIYSASYPVWILDLDSIIAICQRHGYRLAEKIRLNREFGVKYEFFGLIFERHQNQRKDI